MMELIPQGRYRAKCIDAQIGSTSNNGEQIGMSFQIVDGECAGRVAFGYFSFSENAADYTIEKMRNAGWTSDDVTDLASLCPSEIECSITIDHEEYTDKEGETKVAAKVGWVNKPFDGKVKVKEIDEGTKRSLAARMKGKAVASRQGQSSSKPATKPATSRQSYGGGNGSSSRDSHPFAPGSGFGPPDDDPLPF